MFFGRIIEADRASQSKKMRVWNLGFAVFWNVLMLGIFKYVSGISQTLHAMLPSLIPVVKIALPIGISFLYISGNFLSGRCVSRNDKGTE